MVERILLNNQEMLQFNFTDNEEMNGESSCNVSLSVIDGMGIEYADEFNILDSYSCVIDGITGKECKIENNIIKDVVIENGIAQLQIQLKKNFNRALKFVYYVEV